MNKFKEKIFVAGHNGMVGSAIVRALKKLNNNSEIITATRSQLDLVNQKSVENFFNRYKPTQVYLAAAKVGGIFANNSYPADFIYENLMIQSNIIHQSKISGVKKLLFLGSSCIYPKLSEQPMTEDSLLSGKLEETNEPYAVAKIAGIKLCESYKRQYGLDYRSVMPTNLYGQGDNFNVNNSHVIPALIRRFHEAKVTNSHEISIWGTGNVKREFLHVDEMAKACLFVMNLGLKIYEQETRPQMAHINIGSGNDISIRDLSFMISKIIGFKGNIIFDKTKPEGPPRKLMDNSLIKNLGWVNECNLEEGLLLTYEDFLKNIDIFKDK
jgi:GDP-L-fucose synthase